MTPILDNFKIINKLHFKKMQESQPNTAEKLFKSIQTETKKKKYLRELVSRVKPYQFFL